VRRSLATVACLALLGGLVLAPDSGWIASDSRAEAAECAWHRHSKRVVKRVKRGGKTRRAARTKHWWTCDALPSPAPATAPAPAPAPLPAPEPPPRRLGVTAYEFSYTLSRPDLAAGEVTIELNNQGQDAHNLNLQLVGGEEAPLQIAETASRQRAVEHFALPAGTYRLWCSLLEHDEEGMHATLVVKGG
jgi:plastocyanin